MSENMDLRERIIRTLLSDSSPDDVAKWLVDATDDKIVLFVGEVCDAMERLHADYDLQRRVLQGTTQIFAELLLMVSKNPRISAIEKKQMDLQGIHKHIVAVNKEAQKPWANGVPLPPSGDRPPVTE